jgi:hypothetical protein
MTLSKYFPHLCTASLLTLAGVFHNASFAMASVVSLGLLLSREAFDLYRESRKEAVKPGIPEEVRRTMQDINARVATLEYGVKQRGF